MPVTACCRCVAQVYPDNWQTRELAGTTALYRQTSHGLPAPLTRQEVARAKARLHYFGGVLVMERWEDSMALMQRRYGWKDVNYAAHRAGSRRCAHWAMLVCVLRAERLHNLPASLCVLCNSADRCTAAQHDASRASGWKGIWSTVPVRAAACAHACRDSSAERELANQPELLAELRRRNQADLELYDYAVVLHEAQLREERIAVTRR